MKPAITTEYLHTLSFYTPSYHAEHGLGGLDLLVREASQKDTNLNAKGITQSSLQDTLTNIMPEALDNLSYQRIEEICHTGRVEPLDIRLLIQWLVNKEVLPAGSYTLTL